MAGNETKVSKKQDKGEVQHLTDMKMKSYLSFPPKGNQSRYLTYIGLKSERSRLPEFLEEKSAVCFLPSPCFCG